MGEDKVLETMNIISVSDQKKKFIDSIDTFLERKSRERYNQVLSDSYNEAYKALAAKSRPYSIPHGYWTLEVFHNGWSLIPEERVECVVEPNLDEHAQMVDLLGGTNGRYMYGGNPTWRPVTVTYAAYGDNVGSMLIDQHEELQMVHHATAELTYWLGVDNPDRTWVLKDWRVTNMQTTPSNNAIMGFDLTFIYSEAILTRH